MDQPVEHDDFRSAAMAETRLLLKSAGDLSPTECGVSLCVPVEGGGTAALRAMKIRMLLRLVIGIGGLAAGGVMAYLAKDQSDRNETLSVALLGVGLVCSIGGIIVLILSISGVRRFVRKQLGPRYEQVMSVLSPYKPMCVGVEDPATFQKLKVVPEDLAWAAFDVEGRKLILEGLCCRYIIHEQDVISVRAIAAPNSIGTEIHYRVGGVELGVTISHESVKQELKKQTVGARSDPLFDRVIATIGMGDGQEMAADERG